MARATVGKKANTPHFLEEKRGDQGDTREPQRVTPPPLRV